MSEKRRDKKNRVLQKGESQRADGCYMYKYIGADEKTHYIYSWRLVETDKTPPGHKETEPLRVLEREVQRDVEDHIIGTSMTLLALTEEFMGLSKEAKSKGTMICYQFAYNVIKSSTLAKKKIHTITQLHIQKYLLELREKGYKYNTLVRIKSLMQLSFKLGVKSKLIRDNPCDFPLKEIIVNDAEVKYPLSPRQEETFLEYVRSEKTFAKHYDGFYILFNTGLRIGELCGLTIDDVDFFQNVIKVDHQICVTDRGKPYIGETKTKTTRYIPMTDEVAECFRNAISARKPPKIEQMVDGKIGFIFLGRDGEVTHGRLWNRRIHNIVNRYNKTHAVQMPMFTPHICRHTFCTKMARSGMNPVTLQKIMGHSNIQTTMRVYTKLSTDDLVNEMNRVTNVTKFAV